MNAQVHKEENGESNVIDHTFLVLEAVRFMAYLLNIIECTISQSGK